MVGWMSQWYENVPARSNVKVPLEPGCRLLVSKVPSSAVAVWAVSSSFDQVTVVPTATCSALGPNAKSLIDTASPSTGFTAGAVVVVDDGAVVVLDEAVRGGFVPASSSPPPPAPGSTGAGSPRGRAAGGVGRERITACLRPRPAGRMAGRQKSRADSSGNQAPARR